MNSDDPELIAMFREHIMDRGEKYTAAMVKTLMRLAFETGKNGDRAARLAFHFLRERDDARAERDELREQLKAQEVSQHE